MTLSVARQSFIAVLMAITMTFFASVVPAQAQVTAFKQSVAEAAYGNEAIATFYRQTGYKTLFTGNKDGKRRAALLKAFSEAPVHGLPANRYDAAKLKAAFKGAKSARDRGKVEVMAAQMFLAYARDVQTGVLTPKKIDSGIVRSIPRRDPVKLLAAFSKSSASGFMKSLPPKTPEYARLMKAKLTLEKQLASGGWGKSVPAKALKPGQSGASVVALRNRLINMGYMKRTASQSYDAAMQKAVQQFQLDHGLSPDGVAGPSTVAAVNMPTEKRLTQVIVAMERERWLNKPRGKRHVLVNIPDYNAKIIDNGKVTFSTRAVVGKNVPDRRTPEFSDVMEFIIINPTWNVPRSIATKEYLPLLRKNPNAVSHLRVIDSKGRTVPRGSVNFAKYNAKNFPYSIKQPPSRGNALGLVKFMFPNQYNIYLHDTPSKNLFAREKRDFSHGCIRLGDPFDFAYALLKKQTANPEEFFQVRLNTGKETRVDLKTPVPVHLIYRTAFVPAKGRVNYRGDVYGRDAKLWSALQEAGVALRAVQG